MNALTGAEPIIGLVNNMPQAGFAATDTHFAGLLQASYPVRLRRFAAAGPLPDDYEPIDSLWHARLDALIVTGAEPRAAATSDEPAAPLLCRLVDWAAEHTRAAIWSCLSAHLAVFHLDRIDRRRLSEKLSGIFPCRQAAAHPMMDGAPAIWPVPHSRINDLDPAALESAGYTILSRGPVDGADAFAKRTGRSAFLFLQGHPEYAADTLLREYRRDLRRWLAGAARPLPPANYFPADLTTYLTQAPSPQSCLAALEAAPTPIPHWQPHGVRLFRAWLAALQHAETSLSRS